MSSPDTSPEAQEVATRAARAAALHTAYSEALQDRDEAIRAALAAGVGPTEIARVTGLPRSRIYQIRNAR